MSAEKIIKVEIDVPIPMRDGTILRADLYRPDTSDSYPAIVIRIPYNKSAPRYTVFFDPLRVAKSDYAVVIQDCRGTMSSGGEFHPFENEANDGYDSVEWITNQSWCTGKVGMYGISYHALTQLAAAQSEPPGLKAIVPGMTTKGARDLAYAGGAFQLHTSLFWSLYMSLLSITRVPPPPEDLAKTVVTLISALDNVSDIAKTLPLKQLSILKEIGRSDFYFEWLNHPDDDDYWRRLQYTLPDENVIPTLLFTGWYDLKLNDTLSLYENIKNSQRSEDSRTLAKLIIGPWLHAVDLGQQVGELDFGLGSAGTTIDILKIHLRWFDHWLKNLDTGILEEPPVRIFVMGENIWRNENEWPLSRTKYTKYYIDSNGKANSLIGDGKLSITPPGDDFFDTFIYDPENPVPTHGGNILTLTGSGAGAMDQRVIEERQDVLVYKTPPLDKDTEVTGPISVKLYAASSARDTDFTAKLVDIWPDGETFNLADGIIRARYRKTESKSSFIELEKIYEYTIELGSTSNLFKAGHCIGLEISSSNFPRFDRNQNTGHPFGESSELVSATQKLFHNRQHLSHVLLPLIPR